MPRRTLAAASILILTLGALQGLAHAGSGPTPYDACFNEVGAHYSINPLLLKAIARQESSMNPRALGQNTNGTVDIGLMQINSAHLPRLERAGITREHLNDPCINILVGGWVLADAVRRFGMSWKAVGVYHSPTEWRQRDYAARIQRHLRREIEALPSLEAALPAKDQESRERLLAMAPSPEA
jgi:soluble lytic murein transglycosylase-like protein